MTKIALGICVCADDWAAESAIKASNDATNAKQIRFLCVAYVMVIFSQFSVTTPTHSRLKLLLLV